MTYLTQDQLAADLEICKAPLFGGFTLEHIRRILASAIHYAGIAEKHEQYRRTQNAARSKWRRKQQTKTRREA